MPCESFKIYARVSERKTKMNKMYLQFTILITLAASIASCQLLAPSTAPIGAADASRRTITVTGEGVAVGKPDIARLNLGVDVLAPKLADALKQNNTQMTAVIAKMKSLGVADKDLQTTNLSVSVERNFEKGGQGAVTGYRVANTVVAVIRDLNRISDILDQATQAGANNVFGINFGIDNTSKLESEARAKAVTDAQARADDIAKLNNLSRADVITMIEGTTQTPLTIESAQLKGLGGGGGPPVEAGTLEIHVRVQITYAVK